MDIKGWLAHVEPGEQHVSKRRQPLSASPDLPHDRLLAHNVLRESESSDSVQARLDTPVSVLDTSDSQAATLQEVRRARHRHVGHTEVPYTRRKRRKTRADKYDQKPHNSRSNGLVRDTHHPRKRRPRIKRQQEKPPVTDARLNRASNDAVADRLTLHPSLRRGIFKHGSASIPVKSTPYKDPAFHDTALLNPKKRLNYPRDAKQRLLEEEQNMSEFFQRRRRQRDRGAKYKRREQQDDSSSRSCSQTPKSKERGEQHAIVPKQLIGESWSDASLEPFSKNSVADVVKVALEGHGRISPCNSAMEPSAGQTCADLKCNEHQIVPRTVAFPIEHGSTHNEPNKRGRHILPTGTNTSPAQRIANQKDNLIPEGANLRQRDPDSITRQIHCDSGDSSSINAIDLLLKECDQALQARVPLEDLSLHNVQQVRSPPRPVRTRPMAKSMRISTQPLEQHRSDVYLRGEINPRYSMNFRCMPSFAAMETQTETPHQVDCGYDDQLQDDMYSNDDYDFFADDGEGLESPGIEEEYDLQERSVHYIVSEETEQNHVWPPNKLY